MFVTGQQVQAVRENLFAFEEPMRANDDGLRVSAVLQRAGSDGNAGVALSDLDALAIQKRTRLFANHLRPIGRRRTPSAVTEQFDNFVRHSSTRQRRRAVSRYSADMSMPTDLRPN